MEKGSTVLVISLLILITFASQSSGSAGEFAERRQLRPHLQVQQELDDEGKKGLEIQIPSRRLGLGHGVGTVEMKHHGRMVTGHKGGSMGGGGAGGGGAGTGGRNVGGGGAVTRPHNSKNAAAAQPVPVASVLALAFGCGVALSALSF
ncbi:hypothetical protein HU200_033630 [Digitaria exilis]|uniref:Uncharacterized protein n=1 Tax=Digitaria exilis TaxID=1010633 RepID=A0A835BHV5_9POAL|nr:hypothetical protein HU200_033630 [Digitaria exilis]